MRCGFGVSNGFRGLGLRLAGRRANLRGHKVFPFVRIAMTAYSRSARALRGSDDGLAGGRARTLAVLYVVSECLPNGLSAVAELLGSVLVLTP